MANKPLTKEQKLEIVSKAIDAGASVAINFYGRANQSVDELLTHASIFNGMRMQKDDSIEKDLDWLKFADSNFEGTVFFGESLSNPTPQEWQDTGDMEEANA